ncbi:hypothetical protein GCM10027535_57600 [Mycolicibacterium hippocampi]|uniref:Uncharacterized protein n=1 Tax=Mycolicibacterium hippocampi TaxID=659824 RepID=A0A7I9ZVF5_9MYCO|nr:hypothetical protein MHIP_55140 [Mycolicibacterium hippocampi]
MNRQQAIAAQIAGRRVEQWDEPCGHCGRPSTYRRSEDRYYHRDGTPNEPCWVAITSEAEPEPVVSQCDSPVGQRRRAGTPRADRRRAGVST